MTLNNAYNYVLDVKKISFHFEILKIGDIIIRRLNII